MSAYVAGGRLLTMRPAPARDLAPRRPGAGLDGAKVPPTGTRTASRLPRSPGVVPTLAAWWSGTRRAQLGLPLPRLRYTYQGKVIQGPAVKVLPSKGFDPT